MTFCLVEGPTHAYSLPLASSRGRVREGLKKLGFDAQDSPSAIIPIMIGDTADAIRKSERLLELGVWVVAFGFPVVPQGKARTRGPVSGALGNGNIPRATPRRKDPVNARPPIPCIPCLPRNHPPEISVLRISAH